MKLGSRGRTTPRGADPIGDYPRTAAGRASRKNGSLGAIWEEASDVPTMIGTLQEWKERCGTGPASIIAFEIDNLEELARQFGDEGVQEVISALVRKFEGHLKATGTTASICSIDPGLLALLAGPDEAAFLAERLRRDVESLSVGQSRGLAISASFGIADLKTTSVLAAVTNASYAMIIARSRGGNCCVSNALIVDRRRHRPGPESSTS